MLQTKNPYKQYNSQVLVILQKKKQTKFHQSSHTQHHMQPLPQQPQPKQQHTSSRMLQSLLHTYTETQNNTSSIGQSQATIHDMYYEQAMSYRSNASEKQESRLIELIEKKESQLKSLETFLIKEFEQISESKEKHARFRSELENVLRVVGEVKKEIQVHRGVTQQLEQIKHFMKSQVQELFEMFEAQTQTVKRSYEDQIEHLRSIISSQSQQLTQLKSLNTHQSHQISKLTQQLAHNQMTNSSQPFKLEEQHLNKAIEKKESKGQLSQQELEVSFSADKNNKAKQLINVIFHLKSNESLLLEGKEGGEIRNSNRTVEEEHNRHSIEEQRTLTGGFNHILLKGSTSSNSRQSLKDIEPQQASSPQQRSQNIQTSEVQRISSNANYANNDASSAINKLDVFSELNAGDNFQDDDMSYYNQHDDEKYSEMEFRNMRKAKISRSMKAARNPAFGGLDGGVEGNEKLSEIRTTERIEKSNLPEQKESDKKQSYDTPPQQQKPTSTAVEKSQPKSSLTPSKSKPQNSPQNASESPNTKTKKTHRYDYCRLYEEQEIKEIQNINTMCNHLMVNDKPSPVLSSLNTLPAFHSFEKEAKQMYRNQEEKFFQEPKQFTPTRKSREISPRKSSFSVIEPIKFEYSQERDSNTKTFVRSGNAVPSFSNTKKPLTIQIPASPQRSESPNSRNQSNPYLKLQNHLHQLSCQQFSPKRSNYANERNASGYLDRSEGRSRVSYSDLRSETRGDVCKVSYPNIYSQLQLHQITRRTPPKTSEQHIITNNIDRKEYIKSKIEMIKKKNSTQNAPYPLSKSPHKISFLKSQDPENHLSKQELERPNISRQVSRHNRSTHEQEQPIRGYDFSEDKFEKEMMEKSRRTDKSQLKNSTLSSKVDLQRSKDASRVSYSNAANNVSYSKIDRAEKLALVSRDNLKKSSSNVTVTQEEQYNDIYSQLNHNISPQNEQARQYKNPSIQQQPGSRKAFERPTQPTRQSVSPLRPTSKNTNNMYLPQESHKYSMKKLTSAMEAQYMEERYNEENLYKHPYMIDRRKTGEMRVNRNEGQGDYENLQMFRRF